jgi:glyoxylase-like metal-dependent hydrolase (beta-lactamase superfamily II)
LSACPVAAIRLESFAERKHSAAINKDRNQQQDIVRNQQQHSHMNQDQDTGAVVWTTNDEWTVKQMTSKELPRPFPRPYLMDETSVSPSSSFVPGVYWTGHHNEASFGAIPYLLQGHYDNEQIWIMVDSPKFTTQTLKDIVSITGPNGPKYMLLTHVDDTADHEQWAKHFHPQYCQRIFHSGDLGRFNWLGDTSLEHVPILLQVPKPSSSSSETNTPAALTAYTLDGRILDQNWQEMFESGKLDTDIVVLHTPGHSPGSISLYKRRTENSPGILFTGDTYGFNGTKMSGFGRYGHDLKQQMHTLSHVLKLTQWDIIAPGHALSRDYRGISKAVIHAEMEQAQKDLLVPRN